MLMPFIKPGSNACLAYLFHWEIKILRNQSSKFTWVEVYGMGLSQADIARFILHITFLILQLWNVTSKVFTIHYSIKAFHCLEK